MENEITMDPVVIIRHPRERRSKCTLEPLRGRPGFAFHRATPGFHYEGTGHLLLSVDAPPLTPADRGRPLLLLDSTWRLLPRLESVITGNPLRRSLPGDWETAYPRTSKIATDPVGGLASIEALFAARAILGRRDDTLLDEYHWKEAFLTRNAATLAALADTA